MAELLLTKLLALRLEKGLIERPRLIEKTAGIDERKATFFIAPAGYGKTVAMAQMAAASKRPAVWYQLDAHDNDPAIFLQYLVAGLRRQFHGFGVRIVSSLHRDNIQIRLRLLLTRFINALLAEVDRPILLVLDDFHTITSKPILHFVQELLEYLPDHVHLMLAGRTAPAFALARLRAAEEVLTLGVEELRLTDQELRAVLSRDDMPVAPEVEEALRARVDGWPIAARLAADAPAGIAAPPGMGGATEIYEYLAKEVLESQPAEVRDFLLDTSVLEVFTAEDGDLLRGKHNSRQIIDKIEDQQLFLIPLTGKDRTYRYHQLFREFLLERLGPARERLRLRAGQIAEERGDLAEAMELYIAAGEKVRAALLLKDAGRQAVKKGRWQIVQRWLEIFSPREISADPWLALLKARIEGCRGGTDQVAFWAGLAEEGFEHRKDQEGLAESRLLKARIMRYRGYYRSSLELLETVSAMLNGRGRLRFDLSVEKSLCLIMTGRFRAAEALLRHALEAAERDHDDYAAAHLLEGLGNTYYLRGEYAKALQVYRKLAGGASAGNGRLPDYCTQNYIALIYQEWGELDQAYEYARRSVEYKEKYGLIETLPGAYFQLADIHLSRLEPKEAESYLRKAVALIEESSGELFFLILYRSYLAVSLSRQRRLAEAQHEAEEALRAAGEPAGLPLALSQVLGAQVFWRSGEREKAGRLVAEAVPVLEEMGFPRPLGHTYAALTLFNFIKGDKSAAAVYARKTLEISAPRNYRQSFLTSFEAFLPVLRIGLEQGIEVPFVQNILARAGIRAIPLLTSLAGHEAPEVRRRTVVPLTEIADREALSILKMLAADPSTAVAQPAGEALLRLGVATTAASGNQPGGKTLLCKTLGPLLLCIDGAEVTINWRTAKSRDLLAFLVHQNRPVDRDVILEHLWPECDPEHAKGLFHTTLYYLRRTLKRMGLPGLIAYGNNQYSLDAGSILDDRHEFQYLIGLGLRCDADIEESCRRLEEAVRLYRGDYLDGLDYPWVLPCRERFRNLHGAARLQAAGYYLRKRAYNEALAHLESLVEVNPLLEEPHRQLMAAYAGLGDRSSVVRVFRRLTDLLGGELGISPSEETKRLYERLIAD